MDVTMESAHDQARLIRDGHISAREMLDAVLARYEQCNPAINAVVVTQIDLARTRARMADEAMAQGSSWGPLHGVPMTIKESFDWVGTPSTWGHPAMVDHRPEANAVAVDRLLAAGAVIYGKTNVPINLADSQSFNDLYGTTNNPWALDRTPGGSSGGAAAAVATGMAALELGSDIGGSIRNPAHYCGVFGHKPTFGLVPVTGHARPGLLAPIDMLVAGPLARTAADLDLALATLAGPHGSDARGYRLDLAAVEERPPSQFKVAAVLESPCLSQDRELTDQLQATVDALAGAGVRIDQNPRLPVDLERAFETYLLLLRAATAVGATDAELAAHREAASRYDAGDRDYRAFAGKGPTLLHRDWYALHNEREHQRLAWASFFEDYDVLLCPIAASAAFLHDHEGERPDRLIPVDGREQEGVKNLFWAGLGGVAYLPSTMAPAGVTRSGLPCGLQIIGPHLGDRVSIAFAHLVETELGGFVPPPHTG